MKTIVEIIVDPMRYICMACDSEKHRRSSIRLPGYDYSRSGLYFVTICSHEREDLFGEIRRGTISCALTQGGRIAKKFWYEIPMHYPCVELDGFIVMPNHIHGIINVADPKFKNAGVQNIEPLRHSFQGIIAGSLESIIRGYKISVTKWFRDNTDIRKVWQRNYYERIIRNTKELNHIRRYIADNPKNWGIDEDNPINWNLFPSGGGG